VKLVQANIWGARLGYQVKNFLAKEAPDFACLQEIVDIKGGEAIMFLSLQEIIEDSVLKHSYMSPNFSFSLMRRRARFGNAILSRQPFTKKKTLFTRLRYLANSDFYKDKDYNVRSLQHIVTNVNGKSLHVLNHHGHHIQEHKNGDTETMRQCRLIADYIGRLSGPVILTGDFNLAPHSKSLEVLNSMLTNLSIEYGLRTTRTPLTHKKEVCDYIFVNSLIKVQNFYASDELISDHRALILEFDV